MCPVVWQLVFKYSSLGHHGDLTDFCLPLFTSLTHVITVITPTSHYHPGAATYHICQQDLNTYISTWNFIAALPVEVWFCKFCKSPRVWIRFIV